jgi:hypothetical protein
MKQDQEDEAKRDEQLDDGNNSGQQPWNPFSVARIRDRPFTRKYAGIGALVQTPISRFWHDPVVIGRRFLGLPGSCGAPRDSLLKALH